MALKATIFKVELNISDMVRHYYQSHSLVIARHPSETERRMMVRILCFAIHANEQLSFTRGLSTEDEPDLWAIADNGEHDIWILLGQIDEKRIRKACGRARQVIVYTYSERSAAVWWEQSQDKLARFKNLSVVALPDAQVSDMEAMANRNMELQCTIEDGSCWMTDDQNTVQIDLDVLKP